MHTGLTKLAAKQYGLFTREQARALGISDAQLRHGVAAGWWRRCSKHVFAMAGTPVTFRQRALIACWAAGEEAAASDLTGVALFGVRTPKNDEPVHVLVERTSSARGVPGVVHRTNSFPSSDRATIHGIPVLRPARLLCELARTLTVPALEETVDEFLIRKLVTLPRLRRRLDDLSGTGHAGCSALRGVLATWDDDMPQSVAEQRLIRRLVAGGLPKPTPQLVVNDEDGRFVARLDVGWAWAKAGIEMKSFRWHATPQGLRRDVPRDNRLTVLGWNVLDCTPEDLRGPATHLVEWAATLLAKAAA